jgi:hypothetical protein
MGSDKISIEHDDIRLKDSTSVGRTSGHRSSLVPSQLNSGPGTLGFSPRTLEKIGSRINDSFEFDGKGPIIPNDSLFIRNGSSSAGEPDARETPWGWGRTRSDCA